MRSYRTPKTAPGVNSDTLQVELQVSAIMMMPLHKILKKALRCQKNWEEFVINLLLLPLGSTFTCQLWHVHPKATILLLHRRRSVAVLERRQP